jgi:hypothetical protein
MLNNVLRIVRTFAAAVGITIVCGGSRAAEVAKDVDAKAPQQKVLTFRATTREYVEIAPGELRPGHIYSHFDERLGRHVWSIYKPDKTFWHAFAAGTCQPIHLFDWDIKTRKQEEEAVKQLRELNTEISRSVIQEGATIFVELQRNGHWRLTKTSVPSIRDAETGMRWEWQFGRYIPVRRTSDYAY